MPKIEVCFSPALYGDYPYRSGFITVVVDVLRATTAFCAAFDAGVESIIPVDNLERLKELKAAGFLTAGERDGKKVDFADFSNSPVRFLQADLKGKSLAYSTTNGTHAIELAKLNGSMAIASFANLNAVALWTMNQNKNIIILCSGWKDSFSLEDSVCSGAMVGKLLQSGQYSSDSDSAYSALRLWKMAESNLQEFCSHGAHYQRLVRLEQNADLDYCFRLNTSGVVPVWDGKKLVRSNQ